MIQANQHHPTRRHTNRPQVAASLLSTLIVSAIASTAWSATAPGATSPSADDALYTMGLVLGAQLHDNGVPGTAPLSRIDQGIKDALAGKRASGAEQMNAQAYLRAAAAAAAERNAAAAHEFLERNAKTPGVTTLPSGLQYQVIEAGNPSAAAPRPTDRVTVSFRGTLLDGSEFDSSSRPGTASTLQVNGLIKGWTEALTHMTPGAHWRVFVPPELGYGSAPRPGVPGGSILIYDLRLLSIASRAL